VAVADLSSAVEAELARLRAENARLRNLLRMTPQQAAAPVPGQAAFFEAPPGMVHNRSPEAAKVAFFGALFAARTDVYATRWENPHAGKHGWIPAVRGGWRKGVKHEDRGYLQLTAKVIESHLRGEVHVGLYPLLDGDRCWWLAADFDKEEALFDDDGRLVLIGRTKPGQAPYWTTPGGGVEASDASVDAALHRELAEELGAEASGAARVFLFSSPSGEGVAVQHFFVARLRKLDESARGGPEFQDGSRGGYEVDRIALLGDDLASVDLKPDALKEFILANREALLAEAIAAEGSGWLSHR
jgi:ADP-ribose pyrophosphatase YjhB (NUDIX family)